MARPERQTQGPSPAPLLAALLFGAISVAARASLAQVAAGGLGTRVNGTALGRCSAGICSVQGGSIAGPNLFHRFSQFDTRTGIQRVDLDSRGRSNVVVGVSHPAGSFFGAPLQLSGPANLFWLSPGGLWLGNGARFQGATSLLLSTAPTLRIGPGEFNAVGGLADRLGVWAAAPTLDIEALAQAGLAGDALAPGDGPIVLAGGRLSVDRHLLLHSGAGAIRTSPGAASELRAGGSVQLSGGTLQLRGLDIQAGSGANDRVLLRSGPLLGGALGRLELADATLRGTQVRLEGAGGLALERVEARAEGGPGPGMVLISAGQGGSQAAARLAGVNLTGGDVLLSATGPLAATDLRVQAGAHGGGGQLELAAGAARSGDPSLRLERADLQGRSVVIAAGGPAELRQVQARAGRDGDPGGLWLRSSPGPGGTASPIDLAAVRLSAASAVVQAAGDLRARNLDAQAERLWLWAEGPGSGNSGASLSLEQTILRGAQQLSARATGDLAGRELKAEGGSIDVAAAGRLRLDGSRLRAIDETGGIRLEALAAANRPQQGSLELSDTELVGKTIVARAGQRLSLANLTALAGSPGRRGVISLETGSADASGADGEASLVGSRLEGQRVIVRSGTIRLGGNSRIAAPKGMIQLDAKRGDLTIQSSHLDVGVQSEADLRTPVNLLAGTGTNDSRRNTPNIALFAERNLTIGEGSSLRASQDLAPLRAANPALADPDIRLTDTSGIVLADAGQGLLVSDSRVEADASDNLAGNLLLRAQARDGRGELVLRNTSLSASGGAGSGDIRLNSANGMRIENSQLIARSPNSPADPFNPGDPDWLKLFSGSFSGGEITLTNSSSQKPITIVNSQLRAEQSAGGGSLLPTRSFEGAREDAEFFDTFDSNDSGFPNYTGGIVSLFSQGGITISGARTLLSVSSLAEGASSPEDFGGILRLINTSPHPLLISDAARLEARTGAAFHPLSTEFTAAGVINLWNRGPIGLADSSLNSATLLGPDQPEASRYQGSIAIHSASEIAIQRSTLSHGPGPSDLPGLGERVVHSPSSPTILGSTLLPGCGGVCDPRPWDSQTFDNFLHPSGFGPSVWGAYYRAPNPYLLPVGDRVRDQLFEGGPNYPRPLPTSVRGWIDSTPTRTVFQPDAPARRLEDLLAVDPGPLPEALLRNSVSAAVPAAPFSPSWMPSAKTALQIPDPDLRLAINFPAGAENGPTTLLLNSSESVPEAVAAASFAAADQAASREVIGALGLRQPLPQSPSIGALQQLLRQSRPLAAPSAPSAPIQPSYAPAILQISSSPIPGQPLLLIQHVLIPAVGEIRGWQTRVPRDLLQQRIQAFQRQLSQQGDLAEGTAGRQLASLLLDPVLPELQRQGINALLLALDRGLQGIPFAALPVAGGNLVDRVALTITPALGLTDLAPQSSGPQRRRTLLAGASRFPNGLMPLQMAEQELRRLAALHPDALVLLDADFRTRTLIEKSRERPLAILHLATHADFASQRADGARVYTSDGELSLTDLGRQLRNGQAEPMSLFVLNACRTAVGNEDRELGISGLALQAGASSAMGNLWFVDDVVAAAFSVQFHRALEQGLSKDLALQQTQQRFRQGRIRVRGDQIVNDNQQTLISGLTPADQARLGNDLRHPYFWAGMVLTGRPW
jgi:CHAT domain-containing protein